MPENDPLSVEDVAALAGLEASTVRHHCRTGTLPARVVSGVYMIRRADALAFRKKRPGVGRPKERAKKIRPKYSALESS